MRNVSVFIPTYNSAEFLHECLDSMLAQTYPLKQIVVCDDGSADGTVEIVQRYAEEHESIESVLHVNNVGISRNFNSGLSALKGDLFSVCAGDDFWAADKIEKEVEALERNRDARWVYSDSISFNHVTGEKKEFRREFDGAAGSILFEILTRRMSLRNWLAESSLVKEVGFFDEQLNCFEDWDFKVRLAQAARVAYSQNSTVFYRRRQGSVSRNPRANAVYMAQVQEKHRSLLDLLNGHQRAFVEKCWRNDLLHNQGKNLTSIQRVKAMLARGKRLFTSMLSR